MIDVSDLQKIATDCGLSAYEASVLAMAALENAGDVPEDGRDACARATLESYINGDTRGRDLEAMIIRGKHPASRKWLALTQNQ